MILHLPRKFKEQGRHGRIKTGGGSGAVVPPPIEDRYAAFRSYLVFGTVTELLTPGAIFPQRVIDSGVWNSSPSFPTFLSFCVAAYRNVGGIRYYSSISEASVTPNDANSYQLDWGAIPNAEGYRLVAFNDDGGGHVAVAGLDLTATTYLTHDPSEFSGSTVTTPLFTAAGNGSAVPSWQDLTGNSRHATQSSGLEQPHYITGQFNGKPCVRFDGAGDYMQTALFSPSLTNVTIIAAVKLNATGGGPFGNRVLLGADPKLLDSPSGFSPTKFGYYNGSTRETTKALNTNFNIWTLTHVASSGVITVRCNGVDVTGAAGGDLPMTRLIFASATSGIGSSMDFYGLDIWSRVLTAAEITDHELQMSNDFGGGSGGVPSPLKYVRITEDGNTRITEDGDQRILE